MSIDLVIVRVEVMYGVYDTDTINRNQIKRMKKLNGYLFLSVHYTYCLNATRSV